MVIALITILGLIFRLILSNQSFWLDEAASIEIASRPFFTLISSMVSDFHPPLYYLLLKMWLPYANHSEWLIRLPNILIGVATIPATYFLTKEILGKSKSLFIYLPALLLAINPFHIYYSQELRMYGLNTLLTVLSWIYLLRITKEPQKKNFVLFTLFSTLNLYTFYGAFFNLFGQIVFTFWNKKESTRIYVSIFTAILFFLPWMPILLEQFKNGGYLTTALPGWSSLSGKLTLKDLLLIPTKFLLGRINLAPKILYFIVSGISLALVSLSVYFSSKNKSSKAIWFYFLTPLIFAIVISLKTPILGYWRYTSILPALLILIVIGLEHLPKIIKYFLAAYLVFLFLICNIIFWQSPSFQREDWRGLAKFINTENSLIVLNFPTVFAPLKYYLPQSDYYFSQPSLGHLRQDLAQNFVIPSNNKSKVYLLDYLSDLTDSDRKTYSFLKSTGLNVTSEIVFNGLGKVTVFERVK